MLWPTPKNFVRSLRCSFDALMWSQKQTWRLWTILLGGGARPATEASAPGALRERRKPKVSWGR